MAKKSVLARNHKRMRTVARYAEKRAQLKALLRAPGVSDEEKWKARISLQKLPRDASPVRLCSRCHFSGRVKSVYRKFGLGRNVLRAAAVRGDIPGVVKASW